MTLVTVGIICRNESKHIKSLLKSILNQTFKDFEIIIVDGNSTDGTREIAKKVLEKSNIPYKIFNEKDFGYYGPCFARNLVIDKSSKNSKYIAFIDADCMADKNWLMNLYNTINNTSKDIAGAGGTRLIAKTENSMEIIINAIVTSYVATFGNPAFSKRNIKFIESIPNYNAIYKKEILKKFRYDDKLIISDDNEINFRIRKKGYKFLYAKNAIVYHHETNSIKIFMQNMFRYGLNIANTIRKHKHYIRISAPLTMIFLIYILSLIPLFFFVGKIVLIPLILYFIFLIISTIEVFLKTKKIQSILVPLLLPLQHISYACGIIYNLLFKKIVRK